MGWDWTRAFGLGLGLLNLDYSRFDAPNQLSQSLPHSRLVAGSHFVTQIWFRYSAWYFVKSDPRPDTEIGGCDIADITKNYPHVSRECAVLYDMAMLTLI